MTAPTCLIDFPGAQGARMTLAFANPRLYLQTWNLAEVRPLLRRAEACAQHGAWVVGMLTYEAASAFDSALRTHAPGALPLAWFAVFDAPLSGDPAAFSTAKISELPPATCWQPDLTSQAYAAHMAQIRQALLDGEAYQVNYCMRLHCHAALDAQVLWQHVRQTQTQAYFAALDLGRWQIISASPELFFRKEKNQVITRPMKGTAARGRWQAEDEACARALQSSEKNRSENLMIVDLLRNDLARIALPFGVAVPELFTVERYPTVLQMTSTVTAKIFEDLPLDAVFAALFPCGSITGAPKAKAMEHIVRHENSPRGVYCGAIGFIQPGGDAVFNVAIRTVTIDHDQRRAECGIGGGILVESAAADEYAEALLKGRFLHDAVANFDLFETLRVEGQTPIRLDLHMQRLADSAAYFGWPFAKTECLDQLAAWLRAFPADSETSVRRLRITLTRVGHFQFSLHPFSETTSADRQVQTFALAQHSVDQNMFWLYHKTSRRDFYEKIRAGHPQAFDVLLRNQAGELTEFTRGNLVLEIAGEKRTPALACGLLPGCLRAELLARHEIREASLTEADLQAAQRIWFINSLRGWVALRRHNDTEK